MAERRLRLPLARHRLTSRDFARVYAEGARARGKLLVVVVAPNRLERTRLGLSVSKRVWKDAVPRNRVRRIFREAFRLSLAELPAGLDVVMIAGLPRLDPPLDETRRELVQLVQRGVRSLARKNAGRQEP